tara:strand:+ start:413 stop:595 length:183 start_codon:yes stop_codon:yes gene_type:complete
MSNYTSAVKRINKADTIKDLKNLEKSFKNIYRYGFFTVNEFMRLDGKIVDRYIMFNNRGK